MDQSPSGEVAHLVKKFPNFMKPENSLPSSQQSATGPYPETDESRSEHPISFP